MKRALLSLLILLFFAPSLVFAQSEKKKALYFYSENCSLCDEVDEYFSAQNFYDKYEIEKIEVAGPYNMSFLDEFFDVFGVDEDKRGWPAVVFGEEIIIGSQSIIERFSQEMEEFGNLKRPEPTEIKQNMEQRENLTGEEKIKSIASLPIILGAGFIDSASPCNLIVIVILLGILLFIRRSKDVFLSGAFFIAGVTLTYFLLGIGSINYFQKIFILSKPISIVLGIAAIFIGIFNIRYLFNLGTLPPNIFPYSFRRDIDRIFKKITCPLGALAIGFFANLFLIPCSNRPYLTTVKMLLEQGYSAKSLLFLFLYNIIFILPVILSMLLVYFAVRSKKIREWRSKKELLAKTKLIHVIIGAVMIFAGIYLIQNWI